jgi:ribonuclease HII
VEINTGFFIAGIDEAGRGPLAGPVTAASVVLPAGYSNSGINDSKKLTEKKRERIFDEILDVARALSVVSVGARRIERLNIREASLLAMKLSADRVIRQLGFSVLSPADSLHFLIDGNASIATNWPQETIIKGDAKISAIAAASIVAKVTRDRLMQTLEERYPGYGFSSHKGYPTKFHRQAICKQGPCSVHRRTFAGVREFIN